MREHYEVIGDIPVTPQRVFDFLDDQLRITSHMNKPSWMTAGARMHVALDQNLGKRVGSMIHLSGSVLGVELQVDEVVTLRDPPYRKAWETTGHPRLLVIDAYKLGFELLPRTVGCMVRVFIDYTLPTRGFARLVGRLLGRVYARWCTRRILADVQAHFPSTSMQELQVR